MMLVDTGCGISAISTKIAKQMNLEVRDDNLLVVKSITGDSLLGVKRSKLPAVKIAGHEIVGFKVLVGDWPSLDPETARTTPDNLPLLGILGADFFVSHKAEINYRRNTLSFCSAVGDDLFLLRGRWRSVATECRGVITHAPCAVASSEVDYDIRGVLRFQHSTPGVRFKVLPEIKQNQQIKQISGFAVEEFSSHRTSKFANPGFVFFHYELSPDRLILLQRNVNKKLPDKLSMSTANDPDAVMYYYVRIGSIPDDLGQTAADYTQWTRLLSCYGIALDGPYRVDNFDYSLNRDLTVTGVEVNGPMTITWDLEGSRIVRRGLHGKSPR